MCLIFFFGWVNVTASASSMSCPCIKILTHRKSLKLAKFMYFNRCTILAPYRISLSEKKRLVIKGTTKFQNLLAMILALSKKRKAFLYFTWHRVAKRVCKAIQEKILLLLRALFVRRQFGWLQERKRCILFQERASMLYYVAIVCTHRYNAEKP